MIIKKIEPTEFNLVSELENKYLGSSFVLNSENRVHFGAFDDVLLGVISLNVVFDTAEILYLVVDENKRNKGIGNSILNYCLNNLHNIKEVFLEVSNKNKIAHDLYLKNGFKEISIRKNYYKDLSDAIIMKKDI